MLNISPAKKDFVSTFLLVVLYAAGFYGLQCFLFETGMVKLLPNAVNLRQWDSGWYHTLSEVGYIYDPTGVNNLVFFPLFPLIWHIAHVGIWGMCVLNILIFATGFSILNTIFKLDTQNKILWLSIPSVYFAFIPYTEPLFFLLVSTVLYSIKNKKHLLGWIALFLVSLTRPTGVFLAPAFFAMSLLTNDNKSWLKSLGAYVLRYLLPMVLATGLFVWYEYLKSGVWFVFFDIEKTFWGHAFNVPILPFNNHYNHSLVWISALAMFAGFFSLCFLLVLFFKWLLKNRTQNNLLVLSCSYLLMSIIVVMFYNPTWGGTTTNIAGVFRYTMMNPFFYVFLYHFTNTEKYSWKHYLLIFLIANIVWLSFGSYVHIQYFLYFNGITAVIFLYMLHSNKKITWPVMILTALNIFFQIQYFQQFIGPDIFPD